MATRTAMANGNFSNPLTWDGGISIPAFGDIINTGAFNVTIDILLTPQGFIDALKADDLGKRLLNVSTVETTGEQIKALL